MTDPNIALTSNLSTDCRHSMPLQHCVRCMREEIGRLQTDLEEVLLKDRLKTREINLLTPENRELRAAFKNFHRALCERFGYGHDEKHWERDQLSLIEWIAKGRQDETSAVEPSFAGLKLVTVVDGSVPPDTIEFRASDGRVLGRIRQLAIASVKATTPREPPAATTFELNQDRSGCKHCGMLHGHHIVEDEYGRRDVCQRRAQNGTTR